MSYPMDAAEWLGEAQADAVMHCKFVPTHNSPPNGELIAQLEWTAKYLADKCAEMWFQLNDNRNPTAESATSNKSSANTVVVQMFQDTVQDLPGFVEAGLALTEKDKWVLYAEFDTLENSQRADVPEKFAGYTVRTTYSD